MSKNAQKLSNLCHLINLMILISFMVYPQVREEEFTGYHCKASNSLGQHSAKITISGKDRKITISGKDVKLVKHCQILEI